MPWQSVGGKHGKDVDEVSLQTAFEGVESG